MQPDTRTSEQIVADYRVAHDLLVHPELQELADELDMLWELECGPIVNKDALKLELK